MMRLPYDAGGNHTPERTRYVEIREVDLNSDFTIPEGTEATAMCLLKQEGRDLKGHEVFTAVILIQEHWR